jgi:uncharacterized membrane-anchored protein
MAVRPATQAGGATVGSDSRDLTRAEQSYVAQVKYQLRHEPQQRQHQLLLVVRRALLGGQPYDGYARLEKDMGTPAEYAARLQGRGVNAEPEATAESSRSWFRRRR